MILNYIRLAFSNLFREKIYALINIGGLSVGLTASIMLLVWVQDELSFDQFHLNVDRIFRVNSIHNDNGTVRTWGSTPAPVAIFGKLEIPAIEEAIRIADNQGTMIFTHDNKSFPESAEDNHIAYVDPAYFSIFNFPLIKGNAAIPFPDNNAVVISETTATKFFGDDDALGKTLRVNDKTDFIVSGIIKDTPDNSSLKYTILFPFDILTKNYKPGEYWKSLESDWGNYNYETFIRLDHSATLRDVSKQLTAIHHRNPGNPAISYTLQPLNKLHLYAADMSEEGIQAVGTFMVIAIAILLIACVNYINLATARATKRAKEVGIRKTIGASRATLIFQFLTESAVISFLALLFSLVLLKLASPYYTELSGKVFLFTLNDPFIGALLLLTLFSTWIISGIYPALVISSFRPIQVIRGKLLLSGGNIAFRKILVVSQFTLSIIIIIGTLIVGDQLDFIRSKKLGFSKDSIFVFSLRGSMIANRETIEAELLKQPGIEAVTWSDQSILTIGNSTGDVNWQGKTRDHDFLIHNMNIDPDFMQVLGLELVDGKSFSGSDTDINGYILNETAIKEAGIKDPIGREFTLWQTKGTIIGVVKDFHHHSIHQKIEPTVFLSRPEGLRLAYVKTNGKDNPEAIAAAEKLWKQYSSNYPFSYNFLDVQYNLMYKSEQRMSQLFMIFSIITIVISCLGLFGLATFAGIQRMKEIGIRKVMGASVSQIVLLLSKDFLKLVIVALMVATPVSYYAMQSWLQHFAYHGAIHWNTFAIAAVITIPIAFFTISVQTVKAALSNPVKSLRNQ
jgi:ABC-type antimicrobial peptide transport system permease subunit